MNNIHLLFFFSEDPSMQFPSLRVRTYWTENHKICARREEVTEVHCRFKEPFNMIEISLRFKTGHFFNIFVSLMNNYLFFSEDLVQVEDCWYRLEI